MAYNLWFNVCGLIVLTALILINYIKFTAPFKKYTIFLALLWCSTISTVASITNNLLPGMAPLWLVRLSHTTYFIAHGLVPPLIVLYSYSLTDYTLQDWQTVMPWLLPSAFGMLLLITNWFSPCVFWLDELGGYHRGALMPLIYLITGECFAVAAFILIKNRRLISYRERISLLLFLCLAALSLLYQMLYPHMLVENITCAICLMISQMTVQNPELILDGATDMLTKQGFASFISPQFKRGHCFQVGFLTVDNYHELEKIYGFERIESKLLVIAEFLKQNEECIFARTESSTFCFVDKGFLNRESWDRLMHSLNSQKITEYLKQADVGMRFKIKVGSLECPTNADSFGALMELIDIAAKLPRNDDSCVMQLNAADVLALRRRKQIDSLVRRAVSDNMLYVVYQPIYNVKYDRFCCAEALLRMKTELLGDVSPGEFIQIAEENGSILEMTRFVLESVCSYIRSAGLAELGLDRIHINLSAVDCVQPELASGILDCLARYGISQEQIGLEITETAFSETSDNVLANLFSLSETGLSVMLDDYGTGYSNLSRLAKVPLDVVKIDKTLIDDILDSEAAQIILRNTINMIRGLNKRVLIEGIETKAQADYLTDMGCDFVQGYYYARPMDADSFRGLLCRQRENGK